LAFARVDLEVRSVWQRAGVVEAIGTEPFFPTVRAAVEAVTSGEAASSPQRFSKAAR